MKGARRIVGILLILVAIAIWFLPVRGFLIDSNELAFRDEFQVLAFPALNCKGPQCPARAANFSISEWDSGALNLVQRDGDLKLPAGLFTLVPPANAREMVERWRAELRNQGFDGGEFRATELAELGWEVELRMQDDEHARASRFLYMVDRDGRPTPKQYFEYSWIDNAINASVAAMLLLAGALLRKSSGRH